jgi:poly-gamma-glutamate capsule biosynthesis protein CapA/YwtB (metallophosphatase superfamily)
MNYFKVIAVFLIILLSACADGPVFSAEKTLTIVAVGDIMMGSTGSRGMLPPDDGLEIFKPVAPLLAGGDIVFGNLEGPLLDGGESKKCLDEQSRWCFEFKTPTRYGRYLQESGFTVLNLANNHTLDFGMEGIRSTVEALKSLGMEPLGGPAIVELTLKEKRVALAGFSYQATPYSFSILEIGRARELIRKLKATHDLVLVSFHGGAEGKAAQQIPEGREIFLGEDRGNVRQFARSAIDAGADLVIGHGPHVLRALEIYKKRLIAYSLGNFLTYGSFNIKGPNGVSAILKVELDLQSGAFMDGRVIPVKLLNGGIPEPDESGEGLALLKELTHKDRNRFNVRIDEGGRIREADPRSGSPEGH